MWRLLIAILCVSLVLTAGPANAYPNFSLGLGWTRDCKSQGEVAENGSVNHECRQGPRGEALVDLFGIEESPGGESTPSGGTSKTNWSGGDFFSGVRGRDAAVVLLVILALLVTYGIIMGITALFASETAIGVYYSEDQFRDGGLDAEGQPLDGTMRRWGLQASFFPLSNMSFRLHMGAGPASFHRTTVNDETETYRDGFTSKLGLGFAPRPGESGFFVVGESEYLTVYARTFKEFVDNSLPSKAPEYRVTTTGLVGFTLGF